MAFFQYLKETRSEMNHVAWPTRVQTIIFTILVIVVSVITAVYVGLFDYVFSQAMGTLIEYIPAGEAPQMQIADVTTEPIGSTSSEQSIDLDTIIPEGTEN
jgi:preprotein translocase subunit SecE